MAEVVVVTIVFTVVVGVVMLVAVVFISLASTRLVR